MDDIRQITEKINEVWEWFEHPAIDVRRPVVINERMTIRTRSILALDSGQTVLDDQFRMKSESLLCIEADLPTLTDINDHRRAFLEAGIPAHLMGVEIQLIRMGPDESIYKWRVTFTFPVYMELYHGGTLSE